MPVFDSNLMFKTTGDLTVTAQSNGPVTIRGTGIKGMAARVVVPTNPSTSTATVGFPTIRPRYYASADNVTYVLIADHGFWHMLLPQHTVEIITPIVTNLKYVVEELLLGATASPATGPITSGLVTGVGFDWDRAVHFE